MRTSLRALTVAAVSVLCSASMLTASLAAESGAIFHHPRVSAGTIHQAGWASSNWSGYAKTGTFTRATGSWVVPAAGPTHNATYSSAWVGIDGFNNGSLIQTGTESDYYNGSAHYAAWWEILPAAETVIPSITVHAGDHMSASVVKGSGTEASPGLDPIGSRRRYRWLQHGIREQRTGATRVLVVLPPKPHRAAGLRARPLFRARAMTSESEHLHGFGARDTTQGSGSAPWRGLSVLM